MKVDLKQAMIMASENPDSIFADSLKKTIETGKLDQVAREQGIDLSMFGRNTIGSQAQGGIMGAIKDIPSDIAQTGREIGSSIQNRADNINELKGLRQSGERSLVGTTLKQAGQLAGAGADTIGNLIMGAGRMVLSPKAEEKVSEIAQTLGEQALEIPKVQETISFYDSLDDTQKEALDAVGGVLALASEFVGVGAAKRAGTVASQGAKSALSKVDNIADSAINKIANTAENIESGVMSSVDNILPTNKLDTPENIMNSAQSRGYSPVDAKVFSEFDNVDKVVGKEMLEMAESIAEGKKSIATAKRPADIIGESINSDISVLQKTQKEFGKQVDNVAKSLKGVEIDTQPLTQSITELLSEYNISVKGKNIDFTGSEFALSKSAQKDIKEAIQFVLSPKKDAYDVHRIKKTLDGLTKPLKSGEGLQGSAKRLVQDLRRATDDFLDTRFESYNQVNNNFREVTQLLDGAETALGKEFLTSKSAQKMRSVFSNSANRDVVKNFISELDTARSKYNLPSKGNLYNQVYLAERLEDIFGTQAITGLRGQVEGAVKGVRSVAEGLRDPIKGAGQLAGAVVETVARQRPQDRIDFLKELFSSTK
jgi:hypothetical protein